MKNLERGQEKPDFMGKLIKALEKRSVLIGQNLSGEQIRGFLESKTEVECWAMWQSAALAHFREEGSS